MQFRKHPQENNKDLNALQQMEAYLNATRRVPKNASTAKRYGTTSQKAMNPMVSDMYHILIDNVKILFKELPNKVDRVIIELDNEKHPLDSHGIFSFISSTFYIYLECDFYNQYRVEYLFHKRPLEQKIRQLMVKLCLHSHSTEAVFSKDYTQFFTDCLRVQPERHIHLL